MPGSSRRSTPSTPLPSIASSSSVYSSDASVFTTSTPRFQLPPIEVRPSSRGSTHQDYTTNKRPSSQTSISSSSSTSIAPKTPTREKVINSSTKTRTKLSIPKRRSSQEDPIQTETPVSSSDDDGQSSIVTIEITAAGGSSDERLLETDPVVSGVRFSDDLEQVHDPVSYGLTYDTRRYVESIAAESAARLWADHVVAGALDGAITQARLQRTEQTPIPASSRRRSTNISFVPLSVTISDQSEPVVMRMPPFQPHFTREDYPAHPPLYHMPTCRFNRFYGKKRKMNKLVTQKVLVDFVCPRAHNIPQSELMTQSCHTLRRYYHQLECSRWSQWSHVEGKRRTMDGE